MSEPTITMSMDSLQGLADSIAKDYEPRIARLERFVNRLALELAEIDHTRSVLSIEGEGLPE